MIEKFKNQPWFDKWYANWKEASWTIPVDEWLQKTPPSQWVTAAFSWPEPWGVWIEINDEWIKSILE